MKATTFVTSIATLAATTLASPASVVERRADTITPAQFNNFKLFAQYSAAVFCNNENAPGTKIQCGGNWCPLVESYNVTTHSTMIASGTDARGMIALDHTNKLIVVSFRGTVSVRNWITDFVFPQVPCDLTLGCLVHTGFFLAWTELRTKTLTNLKSAIASNPTYKVTVTGHSLGAALATLAVGYIRKSSIPADLYTFGGPRTGNSIFVKYITAQPGAEYRVTHEADPIPRLPPIVFNYRHTSPEYWMKEPTAQASDVTVCEGYANTECNAGTTGFDMGLHGDYFEPVNGCEQLPGTPWKGRREGQGVSDAEIARKLAEFAKEDIQFASGLDD